MELVIDKTWSGEPLPASEHATVRLTPAPDGLTLHIDAPFHDDPSPSHPPGTTPELWTYEVVELFLIGPTRAYLEVEIGPHGHHLVLRLDDVRTVRDQGHPIALSVQHTHGRWQARAHLPEALLPPRPWRANAVRIHGTGDARRYLSHLALPGEVPDFHQPDVFRPL